MPLTMPLSSASALRIVGAGPADKIGQMRSHEAELVSPITPQETAAHEQFIFSTPPRQQGSATASPGPPSVFDAAEEPQDEPDTEPTTGLASDELNPYDLRPPPPGHVRENIETLATRFFSIDHLDVILRDFALAQRFTRFLNQYQPRHVETLKQYVELRKAIAGVQYANAIANQLRPSEGDVPYVAATLDERFEEKLNAVIVGLVEEALPAFLTHRFVSLVTESLVKEITGNNAPIMREMIPALAEVYCITDPSLPDNPIVYASDEFFHTTQYSNDYVIGRNCRFLQGPKTSDSTVKRMVEALTQGHEMCETILNYRRDGSPFMNLLMIAPLYDNKGHVRYFLGCQIDVSPLIEGGRGMESFAQLLAQDRSDSRYGGGDRDPRHVLGELGQMLSEDEAEVIKDRTKKISLASQNSAPSRAPSSKASSRQRVLIGMEQEAVPEVPLWPHPNLGSSGRLPGVYRNYLLVRPYPSLRITFTSPALRIPGLLQTKFLDRIGSPQSVQEGLLDAFMHGTGVTARVSWLTGNSNMQAKPRWIHCTPLLGSDERVGVWMVIMVESETVTGQLNKRANDTVPPPVPSQLTHTGPHRHFSSKLYADYLRREDRPATRGSQKTSSSVRERREAEDSFQDF